MPNLHKPKLIVMVGLPCSGKSTLVNEINYRNEWTIISTDDLREEYAVAKGINYNQTFTNEIAEYIDEQFNKRIMNVIENKENVIIDQTNIYYRKRKWLIEQFPEYSHLAVCLKTSAHVCWQRNMLRDQYRQVPIEIFQHMTAYGTLPKPSEGFNEIQFIN